MGLLSGAKCIFKAFGLLLALAAVVAYIPSLGNAQKPGRKLSKDDVIGLLSSGVASADVVDAARKSGISFQVTASVEKEIRDAGGTDDLIRVLRSLAPSAPPPSPPVETPHSPPPASPPVLMIESTPGQSEVYVDDEPVGVTSQAGRLKLTRLAAGDHRVRISLIGYQDHEQTVTLTTGEIATVAATLQRAQVAQIAPAPQPQVSLPAPAPEQPKAPAQLDVQVPAQPITAPALPRNPGGGFASFIVAHDHGQAGKQYCVGVMSIGNGMIYYKGTKGTNGVHNFEIPLNSVREARRNAVYLVAFGAFHINTKKGSNFNFVALNQQLQFQPPDAVLTAIDSAMGR
jgi:hypothetical protein